MPETIYDFDPRNLPADFLESIGLCVTCAAQTQYMLEAAIWGCLGLDTEFGMAITTHMPQPLRISTLKAAAEIRLDDPDLLDELDDLIEVVQTVLIRRNDYVHQSWAVRPDTGAVYTAKVSARGSVNAELILQSVDDIKSESLAIYNAGIELWKFLARNNLIANNPEPRPRGHKTKNARKKRRKQS